MIEAVLFDLDDTLYPEEQYIRSGFAAVGQHLAAAGYGDADALAGAFCDRHFGTGRDSVFDAVLDALGLPRALVPALVDVFRRHEPRGLSLYPDADAALAALRPRYRLGVVTDGWTVTQEAKVRVLGLRERVDAVFLSDALGRARWKPHPEPFLRCLAALGVADPARAVFVGDNPERDMAGAHAAGLHALRVARAGGYFAGGADADALPTLDGLPARLAALEAA